MSRKWWELPVSDFSDDGPANQFKKKKKSKPSAKKRRAEARRTRLKYCETRGPLATLGDVK